MKIHLHYLAIYWPLICFESKKGDRKTQETFQKI